MSKRLGAAGLGVLLFLAVAEALLRLLPVSTATMSGYYVHPDILTSPPGHAWTVSTGWDLHNPQHHRANNWGFASEPDFDRNPLAVALVGDSFVEASMLDASLRPAAQLRSRLGGDRPVFGLGIPGTALLDYAVRIRLAYEKFGIVDQVVWLEAGDARQALCGSGNVNSKCLDPQTFEPKTQRIAPPDALRRVARHSATAQYVFGQLKLDPRRLLRAMVERKPAGLPSSSAAMSPAGAAAATVRPADERSRRVVDAVLAAFFAEVEPLPLRRLIFLVDGRRVPSDAPRTEIERERDYLLARLRARGAEVVDLEPVYAAHAARSRLSLEVGPYDRHLNGLGVALVTQAAADALRRGDAGPMRSPP